MPPVPRVSGRALVRALGKAGWILESVEGSHHVMRGPTGRVASIPVHGAKTLPVGMIKGVIDGVIDRTGLSIEEFVRLL